MNSNLETALRWPAGIVFYSLAIAVGALTGVVGTIFHLGVEQALAWPGLLRSHLAPAGIDLGNGAFLFLVGCISALMVVLSLWLVRRFAPEAGGSGVQEIEGAMEDLRPVRWARVLPVKFVGGFLALSAGLVLGREGPTIHMGASIARAAMDRMSLSQTETRGLLAAGAAAGLTAAFSAPFASILFVIEETRRQFPYTFKTYTGVMLACAASGIVTQQLAGIRPFMFLELQSMPLATLPAFVGLGVILGFVGVAFNLCLVKGLDLAQAVGSRTSFYIYPAIVGFAIGILMILLPEATGGGDDLVVAMVQENLTLAALAGLALLRFGMVMFSYSTGVPGGIFAPLLALGTACGLLYGLALELVLPLPAGAVAVLGVTGMAALFSATIRAPLVGVMLIVELTGAYNVLVPALVASMVGNLVAEWMGGRPIYSVLLERTLRLAGQSSSPPPVEEGASHATADTPEQRRDG